MLRYKVVFAVRYFCFFFFRLEFLLCLYAVSTYIHSICFTRFGIIVGISVCLHFILKNTLDKSTTTIRIQEVVN